MNWNDFLQVLRVRAVEEADAQDCAWDPATNRAVTLSAAGRNDAEFLAARAARLVENSREPALMGDLQVPSVPGWTQAAGSLAAFMAGWWFAALGQDREVNLLALPLIAILVWNAVVLLLSLFHGAGKAGHSKMADGLASVLDRRGRGAAAGDPGIRNRFRALAWPAVVKRTGFRLRAWLHLGAALLALGGAAGMYARGWSREYRAVWESTILNESGARAFFGALFAPASKVTGIAIPLDVIPQMRRGADTPPVKSGAALPWIHLYAATLGLLIIVPRVLFALLELARANRVPDLELQSPDWRDYLAGARASAEGDGVTVGVIAHGLPVDDAARERWRRLARARWRDAGGVGCQAVAAGDEVDFVKSWTASTPRVLLIFNLSATPETEVHRALAESVLAKLRQSNSAAPLALALDDTELKKRWSGFADAEARLATRAASWREVMRGLAADWI